MALLVAAVGGLVVWLCVTLRAAVTPVLLALLGAALLGPLNRRLLHLGMKRSLAAALTCTVLVAVVGGAGFVVVNALVETGDQILDSLEQVARQLEEHFRPAGSTLDAIASNAKSLFGRFGGAAASGLLSGIGLVGQLIAIAVLALLLTFFFLRDAHRVPGLLRSLAPGEPGLRLETMARHAFESVEGFMRGTTLIALIDAVCIAVGLLILRVPGAVGLGALVFVGAYIPYLGAFISGALAVLVALADRGFAIALWAVGIVIAVQLLEGHVLQPVIQSRTVDMHPAMVLVAITAGASLAGILGMLLAVPITAAAIGIVRELRRHGMTGTTTAGSGSSAPDSDAPPS